MSAAHHEAMAAGDEQSAAAHEAHYDPDATAGATRCRQTPRGGSEICWSSTVNPTEKHRQEAERHRKMAADHRAASQALKDAEAHACSGIADDDRDMSPFAHREDIVSAEALNSQTPKSAAELQGATITFRARPGMTAQWFQRVVDCHLARNAVLGHDVAEMAYCPLVLKNVTARVTEATGGFAVAVTSSDPSTARDVLKRAQALVSR
jgi:hypothetical protein